MLAEEGLFEPERKRPLPVFPQRLGVVTSAQAAALQDVLNVMRRRYPLAEVILSPTPVQGADAPPQIVAAFNRLAALEPPVDVILLVRGGGSIEDLWAFNDETLARTVAASPVPVVTGVGHETDFTIVDFVADQRAPTPSAAAELVTPDLESVAHQLQMDQGRLSGLALIRIQAARSEARELTGYLRRLSPQRQIDARRQQIDEMSLTFNRLMGHLFTLRRTQLASAQARLKALNPQATLARGYAIIQKGGQLVTGVQEVAAGDAIIVTMQDGDFEATVRGKN
jgi:exodeoxyribonuclease VII large subunit